MIIINEFKQLDTRKSLIDVSNLEELTSHEKFFQQFKKNDETGILQQVEYGTFHFASFINFWRYYAALKKYLGSNKYQSSILTEQELISIVLKNKQTLVSLQLSFQKDGLVKFTSLDDDKIEQGDKRIYLIQGSFSSSTLLSKSYKIKRLMRIIEGISETENSKLESWNYLQETMQSQEVLLENRGLKSELITIDKNFQLKPMVIDYQLEVLS